MSRKTALIAGATGLVGSHLLKLLLEDPYYEQVKVVTRRPINISNEKYFEIVLDFDNPESWGDKLKADHVFSCLGTTMKKAGSKPMFRKVDLEYPVQIAQLTKSLGASLFGLISAAGANKNSIFFYNRIKGEAEQAIREIGFEHYIVLRPSLILGERKENRTLEDSVKWIIKHIDPLFFGPFRKYKGVEASMIASKMFAVAKSQIPGEMIIDSQEIQNY